MVLNDGTAEWGDCVVGADGLCSTIRKLVYPHENLAHATATQNATQIDGYMNVATPLVQLGDCPCEIWGHRRNVSFYPLYDEGRVAFSATLFSSTKELRSVEAEDPGERLRMFRAVLSREFAQFTKIPELQTLFRGATVATPTELIQVPIMPHLASQARRADGRCGAWELPRPCLLKTASLCVEDAAVLATALSILPNEGDEGISYSLSMFEKARRYRIEYYLRQSAKARRFAALPPIFRNGVLSLCARACGDLAAAVAIFLVVPQQMLV